MGSGQCAGWDSSAAKISAAAPGPFLPPKGTSGAECNGNEITPVSGDTIPKQITSSSPCRFKPPAPKGTPSAATAKSPGIPSPGKTALNDTPYSLCFAIAAMAITCEAKLVFRYLIPKSPPQQALRATSRPKLSHERPSTAGAIPNRTKLLS